MGILDFLSPEAGQRRRQWLNRQEEAFTDNLRGYLGPAANPILGVAQIAGALSPGADMMEAAQASGDLTRAQTPVEIATAGAGLAGSLAAMFLPGTYSTARQGVADLIDEGVDAHNSGALFMFGGPRAATADLPALDRARTMIAEGATRDEVRDATNWFPGADGKFRFEIDDSASRFEWPTAQVARASPQGIPLSAMFDHQALYDAYPGLANLPVGINRNLDDGFGRPASGLFVPRLDGDQTDAGTMFLRSGVASPRSVVLHEGQHALQGIEGFTGGATPTAFGIDPGTAAEQRFRMWRDYGFSEEEARRKARSDVYQAWAGEVEARNVQNRAGMTEAERLATAPWLTQDLPPGMRPIVPGP